MTEPEPKTDPIPPHGSSPRALRWRPRLLPEDERQEVISGILDGAYPTRRFYVLLILSTTIAAFGLLANSTAVIIGAMIVAPLMGPILGLALGLVSANHGLERRALLAETSGVALALLVGFSIGLIPFNMGIGSEMLARTAPTTYDIGVAFASGLAAGYASVNRKINSALAGVAISVALVPPLTTSGLLLAMGEPGKSLGAFLLFLANFFCIQTAAALVFWFYRLHRPDVVSELGVWRYRLRFAPGLAAVGVMAWFMTGTLLTSIEDHRLESRLHQALGEQIARRTGGQLDRILQRAEARNQYVVVASVLTPKVFETEQVRQIEGELRRQIRQDLTLILRSVVSQDVDHSGRVYLSDAELSQAAQAGQAARFLDDARTALSEQLRDEAGATLDSLERVDGDGETVLVAVVRAPKPFAGVGVVEAEEALARKLGQPIRLVVRNVVTRVFDRAGELYAPEPEKAPQPDPKVVALRQRVYDVLAKRMRARPARRLLGVEVRGPEVMATAEATQPVRPGEVAAIEADLRRFVQAGLRLSVRTELASSASAGGWETEGR